MSRINVVDVGVSKPVSTSQSKQNQFDLEIELSSEKATLRLSGKKLMEVSQDEKDLWVSEIHSKLVEIKKTNLDEYKLKITPENTVPLEKLMKLMDSARELVSSDEEIIKTEKDGTKVKVQYLFPSIVLKGVYNS